MLKISKAAVFAAALAVSLSLGAAQAQDIQLSLEPPPPDEEVVDAGFSFTYSVPTVLAVGANMDELALREALNGKVLEHADELATLDATSITIPEISLSYSTPGPDGKPSIESMSYRDIVFADVKGGIAKTVTLGSGTMTSLMSSQEIKPITINDFDIGALLAIFTPVASRAEPVVRTIYSSYASEGQKLFGADFSCEVGAGRSGAFKARPPKIAFADFLAAVQKTSDSPMAPPPPEAVNTTVRFVADMFMAIESDASSIDGVACTGKSPDGKAFSFGLGKVTTDAFGKGTFPGFGISDLAIYADDGSIGLSSATFKGMDLSGPVAAIEANADLITAEWLAENYRLLIPAWAGLAFSGLAVDVPEPSVPGGRAKVSVADFDLSLADYINGIPSRISSSAKSLVAPLPQDGTDPQIALLLALGMTEFNLGYDLAANWDAATKTIKLDRIAVSGVDLGSIAIAATIGNAAEQIFAVNPQVSMAALMGVTVKDLRLDVTDSGLSNIVVPVFAGGADPVTFRQQMAGMAEGMVISMLGSTDAARSLGAAIGNFVNGTAGSITVNVVANDPLGIPIPLLLQASEDPTVLGPQVTITGAAQ